MQLVRAEREARQRAVALEEVASACRLQVESHEALLEEKLEAQLRELDPSIGDRLRGVSVHHLMTTLMDESLSAGFGPEATLSDLESKVLRGRSEAVRCPCDCRIGTSYAGCLRGLDQAGMSTHLASFASNEALCDVVGALEEHCRQNGLAFKRTYVWTGQLCLNQHRPDVREDGEPLAFIGRARAIGRPVFVLAPWEDPRLLSDLRCLSQLWEALALGAECETSFILPPGEIRRLRAELAAGANQIGAVWRTLMHRRVEDAKALNAEERERLLRRFERGPGFAEANSSLAVRLQSWLATCLEQQLRQMILSGEVAGEPAARLCDKIGWLLWEAALYERAGELLQDGLQLSLEAMYPQIPGRVSKNRLEIYKAMTNLEVFKLAGSTFEKAGEQDTPSIATLLTHMGVAKGDRGDHVGALEALSHAKRIREATKTLETPAGAVLLWNIGFTHDSTSDRSGAMQAYEEARKIRRLTGTLDTPSGARLQRAHWRLAASRLPPMLPDTPVTA